MSEHRKPDVAPGYVDAAGAARYLNVSKTYFGDHVRQYVTEHDFRAPGSKKPMPKYAIADLDEWAQKRRVQARAS